MTSAPNPYQQYPGPPAGQSYPPTSHQPQPPGQAGNPYQQLMPPRPRWSPGWAVALTILMMVAGAVGVGYGIWYVALGVEQLQLKYGFLSIVVGAVLLMLTAPVMIGAIGYLIRRERWLFLTTVVFAVGALGTILWSLTW